MAALTVGYPLWWILGVSAAAYPLIALMLVPNLIRSRRILVPRYFGLWAGFTVWIVLSATQIAAIGRLFSFGYRLSVYFAATVLFLWVYNRSERELSTRRAMGFLVLLWSAIAIGGIIGAAAPRLQFSSVAEMVLPARLFSNPLVYSLAHPQLAQVSRLFGQEIGRPNALFPYTNGWGSAFGILLPVTVAWLFDRSTARLARVAVMVLMALSFFSIVASLNRGLWISIGLSVAYTTWRLARRGDAKAVVLAVLPIAAIVVALLVSPFGELVSERAESGHSDDARTSLYQQSIDLGLERPVLGWGVPQPREDKEVGPSVGTHGHFWLVLVGQGIVGAALYMSWWASVIVRTWRQTSSSMIWMHATVIVVTVQSFFYEHTPIQLPVAMIVAALLLRSRRETSSSAGRDAIV